MGGGGGWGWGMEGTWVGVFGVGWGPRQGGQHKHEEQAGGMTTGSLDLPPSGQASCSAPSLEGDQLQPHPGQHIREGSPTVPQAGAHRCRCGST